ncbi:succinate dehydrogenase, hydrophobic membrane anchor protein [Pseudohoeflea coraliihabitans]|uniref:Succinate dehydrogenase hydrophobic membrane anchor subunit n=1 Tax=Pseudohoeflea coraliihabitans TaxID=2860393 RepID=A0ABS6WLH3_9HYPH|nr:succinate dehydrogenase, hydrophobic membrane anchor protein [Pseudohoeflea sp. DP4N28-3]MBW3096781.1 succinate dehydrogenase, hydrophobic membrane anchor protein [Pseudohoeflea sp. DP4N28-3]
MRTTLGRVRGLGTVQKGTGHFWLQRLTAVANIPLFIFFIFFLVSNIGASHAEITAAFANPLVAALFALMALSGLVHMRIGMQVIIEDYVHSEGPKIVLLMLNIFFAVAMGALLLFSILKLGFGG